MPVSSVTSVRSICMNSRSAHICDKYVNCNNKKTEGIELNKEKSVVDGKGQLIISREFNFGRFPV